jgi:hypothetical protein
VLVGIAAAVVLGGCGGTKGRLTTAAKVAGLPLDRWGTTWLCRPGMADDPCTAGLASTAIARNGSTRSEPAAVARNPRVDCFYVYPTISDESAINSDLAIGLRQAEVAIAQASRFSQVCRVYAPVYRQITLSPAASRSRTH